MKADLCCLRKDLVPLSLTTSKQTSKLHVNVRSTYLMLLRPRSVEAVGVPTGNVLDRLSQVQPCW